MKKLLELGFQYYILQDQICMDRILFEYEITRMVKNQKYKMLSTFIIMKVEIAFSDKMFKILTSPF